MKFKSVFFKKWVSFLFVASPILAMYGINLSTVTLLDFLLVITIMTLLLLYGKEIKFNRMEISLIIIIFLIFLNYFFNLYFFQENYIGIFLRTFRLCFYLLAIVIGSKFVDMGYGIKYYRFFSVFAIFYLIIQYILLIFFDYSLKGYIDFLPVMRQELISFTENLRFSSIARPRSIFNEPSQIGLYVSGYLALSVFYHEINDKRILQFFLTIGLLLTASTTAIFSGALIWGFYLIYFWKKTVLNFIALLGWLSSLLVLILTSSRITLFIGRLPSSLSNRLEGFIDYFYNFKEMSIVNILFGNGMNLEALDAWYSGFMKIFYYYGILGMCIFIMFLVCLYIQAANRATKLYILIFFALGVFSELFVSNWLLIYIPFILQGKYIITNKQINKSCCKGAT